MSETDNRTVNVKEKQREELIKKLWEQDGVSIEFHGGWIVRGGKMPVHYFGDASIEQAMRDAALRLSMPKARDLREFIYLYREALNEFCLTVKEAMMKRKGSAA